MSIRFPACVLLGLAGASRARALLALGAIALVLSTSPPAIAAESFKPTQIPGLKAAKASPARTLRNPGTLAGRGLEGRDRPNKRVGKPRRPPRPPLLTIPLPPPGSGDDPRALPHRAERAP